MAAIHPHAEYIVKRNLERYCAGVYSSIRVYSLSLNAVGFGLGVGGYSSSRSGSTEGRGEDRDATNAQKSFRPEGWVLPSGHGGHHGYEELFSPQRARLRVPGLRRAVAAGEGRDGGAELFAREHGQPSDPAQAAAGERLLHQGPEVAMRCVLRWWWKGKLYRCALTGTYVDCLLVPHAGEDS
jgi:hypothetical protein